MILGFTGTRRGMDKSQRDGVEGFLLSFHLTGHLNGGCIGADREILEMLKDRRHLITILPGDWSQASWAFSISRDWTIREPKPYLERNRDIVAKCDHLLACPGESVEQYRGSGTWATIRYARRIGRAMSIFFPINQG